jgi:endonuclease/exonuclease/phosphatase family metal-dependent hydrolase
MRVATYNVHGFVGGDGRRDVGRTGTAIRSLECQVVGLQEVDTRGGPDRLATLAESTELTVVTGPTLHEEGGFFGNTLLTSCIIDSVVRHPLTVGQREPRGVLDVVLRPPGGEEMRVLVTHLGLDRRERREQVFRLTAILERGDVEPVVLIGDLNEWRPLAPSLWGLRRVFGRQPRPRSFPARRALLRLDSVWVRPRRELVSVSSVRTPLTRIASDHLPVVAELRSLLG